MSAQPSERQESQDYLRAVSGGLRATGVAAMVGDADIEASVLDGANGRWIEVRVGDIRAWLQFSASVPHGLALLDTGCGQCGSTRLPGCAHVQRALAALVTLGERAAAASTPAAAANADTIAPDAGAWASVRTEDALHRLERPTDSVRMAVAPAPLPEAAETPVESWLRGLRTPPLEVRACVAVALDLHTQPPAMIAASAETAGALGAPAGTAPDSVASFDPADRRLLRQLRSCTPGPGPSSRLVVSDDDADVLFEAIEQGRVTLANHARRDALTLGGDLPVAVRWEPAVGPDGTAQLHLVSEPDLRTAGITSLPVPCVYDAHAHSLRRIPGLSMAVAQAICTAPPVPASASVAVASVIDRLPPSLGLPPCTPIAPEIEELVTQPNLVVTLEPAGGPEGVEEGKPRQVNVGASVDYGGHVLPLRGHRARDALRIRDGRVVRINADTDTESALSGALREMGLDVGTPVGGDTTPMRWSGGKRAGRMTPPAVLGMLGRLRAAGADVQVGDGLGVSELDAEAASPYGVIALADAHTATLDAGIDIEGQRIALFTLFEAYTADPAWQEAPDDSRVLFVPVPPDRFINLPASAVREVLAPFLDLLDVRPTADGPVRVPRAAMMAALATAEDSEIALLDRFDGASHLVETARSLCVREAGEVSATPDGFAGTLHDYQREGVAWLARLARAGLGGCLADEMGLGKTVQLLAAMLLERRRDPSQPPVLVSCPASVASNWLREAARFTPGLKVLDLTGPERRPRFADIPSADVCITNNALLHRDADLLTAHTFSLAVFDESQLIKNETSQTYQAALAIRAARKLVVSGSPIENHLGDLYSMARLAMPGLLGTEQAFRQRFRRPIESEGSEVALDTLRRLIHPFMLRRTKQVAAPHLPAKNLHVRRIEMGPQQRAYYDTAALAMNRDVWAVLDRQGLATSSIQILAAITHLRQICCHPRLGRHSDASGCDESAKLDAIYADLADLMKQGRQSLVVSEYVGLLDIIASDLRGRGIGFVRITGRESRKAKDHAQAVFQQGNAPVMLLSLKAGGVGINLTAASAVLLATLWWNPGAESQSIDRAHRIGQASDVDVFKYVVCSSIEESIVAIQQRKAELASAILAGGGANARAFDIDDIVSLFGQRGATL